MKQTTSIVENRRTPFTYKRNPTSKTSLSKNKSDKLQKKQTFGLKGIGWRQRGNSSSQSLEKGRHWIGLDWMRRMEMKGAFL